MPSPVAKARSDLKIVLIHPNYHSGGAEIAGSWPPAWAAYLTGALKANGFSRCHLHRRDDPSSRR